MTVRTYRQDDGTFTVGTSVVYDTFQGVKEFLENKGYPDQPIYRDDDFTPP